jgi:hypothetical protein
MQLWTQRQTFTSRKYYGSTHISVMLQETRTVILIELSTIKVKILEYICIMKEKKSSPGFFSYTS